MVRLTFLLFENYEILVNNRRFSAKCKTLSVLWCLEYYPHEYIVNLVLSLMGLLIGFSGSCM